MKGSGFGEHLVVGHELEVEVIPSYIWVANSDSDTGLATAATETKKFYRVEIAKP